MPNAARTTTPQDPEQRLEDSLKQDASKHHVRERETETRASHKTTQTSTASHHSPHPKNVRAPSSGETKMVHARGVRYLLWQLRAEGVCTAGYSNSITQPKEPRTQTLEQFIGRCCGFTSAAPSTLRNDIPQHIAPPVLSLLFQVTPTQVHLSPPPLPLPLPLQEQTLQAEQSPPPLASTAVP
ncbi:unnamed protein product, partial [Ectocarpus sp. 6 AP-2014]